MGRVVVVLGDAVGDGWRVGRLSFDLSLWLGLGLNRGLGMGWVHGHLAVEER